MANFREKTPARSTGVEIKNSYRSYRPNLAEDFHHRCGYCNVRDVYSKMSFEIDHFVPKGLDKDIPDNKYSNLVYSCRSCNNAKRRKWPTNNPKLHNDGHVGWVDPCSPDYEKQLGRDDWGYIIPLTEVGAWMHNNLKLGQSMHQVLWNIEQLEVLTEQLANSINVDTLDPKVKQLIIAQQMMLNLIKSLW